MVLRCSGPLKVVEQTGTWGVYSGERIVLGDGTAVDDDLGMRIRRTFDGGEDEAVALPSMRVVVETRRRAWVRRAAVAVALLAIGAAAGSSR